MNTKSKFFVSLLLAVTILLVNFGGMPGIVYAAEGDEVIDITVTYEILCGEVTFTITLDDITLPYQLEIDYGDVAPESMNFASYEAPHILPHTYSGPGDYNLTITVTETGVDGLTGTTSGVITIDDPAPPLVVKLNSTPFPPLVVLTVDSGLINFSADVTGGTPDLSSGTPVYTYAWDANGDGIDDGVTAETTSNLFTAAGKYQARVTVTDTCDLTSTDTLSVVVVDQGDICHPTAQKIADGVNKIFPNQAGDLYTCEEIYDIFNGGLTGDQVGFGRMWKAYNLALTMEELTWEEIRDWHLDTGGWGALLQLDRFSDLLEDHSIVDMMALVMSEDYTLGDVRTAVRSTTRYEADFDDALARIADGANAGELGQFYKLAADLALDPADLDVYLTGEFTLSELKHTANLADRMGVDWTEIADAGGVQEYMKDLREADKVARAEQQATQQEVRAEQQTTQQEDKNQQTANKLAEQYPDFPGDVMSLFNGDCEENWGCVRKTLREQEQTMTQAEGVLPERDFQTAQQIASKYGIPDYQEVIGWYENDCSGDWACTRAHFREIFMSTKETGKPEK